MPTTGLPGNIWYPDDTSPVAPLENLFLTQATSVNVAISAQDATVTALNKIFVVANLSALDALATAKIGDLATVTTLTTGVTSGVEFYAESGSGSATVWRTSGLIAVDTKVNLDALKTAVDAITDIKFGIGTVAKIGSVGSEAWLWTGAKWKLYSPYAEFSDKAITTGVAGSGGSSPIFWGGEESVTFPVGMFSVAPIVSSTPLKVGSGIFPGVQVSDITAASFKYRLMRIGAIPSSGSAMLWGARQATASSAAG